MNNETEKSRNGGITRAEFVKISALLGGTALLAGCGLGGKSTRRAWGDASYDLAKAEDIIYSTCQQCATHCGIKVKLLDGVVAKIDGNPYSPWNMMPHLDYKTPVNTTATIDASICPKGHSGAQTTYDPYRLVKVVKRDGPRGSNKWISIPFDKAIEEIVNGGALFSHVPGEENRNVEGLKDIWALRDPAVMKSMKNDVDGIWAEKDQSKKAALVELFKVKHKANLDKLIDPEHPDLGPKNNQFAFMFGRLLGGRVDLLKRFTNDGMGSINVHGHTTVCQGSLFQSAKAISEQFNPQTGMFSGGQKFFWMADVGKSEFVIFTGASPFEASYGPTSRAMRITDGLDSGRLKYAVVDPRFSKAASKAWKWLPAIPGTEAALALALMKLIIENDRHDKKYLANANKAAADADGEPTWSNAAWLVKVDGPGATRFLRASDLGMDRGSLAFDPPLVLREGKIVAFNPNDTVNAVEGDLMVDIEIDGKRVKSSLQLLWEEAASHSIDEWATICGVKAGDLEDIAFEFTSHGKKAAADVHRGVSQHTNGFYNATAWWNLNMLIGNYDWQGGMIKLSVYDTNGITQNSPFTMSGLKPGALVPFGVNSVRRDLHYEETTLFSKEGYPARRNWFPLSEDIYQEVMPSAADGYPYPLKALFLQMGSPVYVMPAGQTLIEILADPTKIPLMVVTDIVVGETSMYADYIFPDLTYLERWEFAGSQPTIPFKSQPMRQPAVAPLVDTATVFGREMPLSFEALLLGLAEKLGLPAFGADGFGPGQPLKHQDDLYLRMAANLAFGDKADGSETVPDADTEEMRIFLEARRNLPKSVYDPDRWRALAGEKMWPKVVYVLNRGGRFQDLSQGYLTDQKVGNKYGKLLNMFQEKTAGVRNSQTGALVPGYAKYITSGRDIFDQPLEDEKNGFDLRLITYREIARTPTTPGNYYTNPLLPENSILINQLDADRLGFKDDDVARVISASNPKGVWDLKNGEEWPMNGRVNVMQGIRPGVIAFSLGHGHFAYGGVDITIDGHLIKGEKRRSRGINANAAMRIDPHLKNTCLVDTVGGSAVFYDTQVRLEKVNI